MSHYDFWTPGKRQVRLSASKLARITDLPLYHLDRYFYIENWQERDYKEFLRIQEDIVVQDRWIIDGNNSKSFELRYQRAHIAIYFCYPKLLSLYRVIKRVFSAQRSPNS